jgi:hypothetical protein
VVVLLLCLLLLALEGSEVGEEIAQLLGRLWGMTGLLEIADALWAVSAGDAGGRGAYVEDELQLVFWGLADLARVLWDVVLGVCLLWVVCAELDGHLLACHELSRRSLSSSHSTSEKPKQYTKVAWDIHP